MPVYETRVYTVQTKRLLLIGAPFAWTWPYVFVFIFKVCGLFTCPEF
jgi:hypothetical protein